MAGNNVVNLDDHRPHLAGPARCLACGHEWVAVSPVGTVWLDCPACGCHKGIAQGPVAPAPGSQIWRCNCGCDVFMIRPQAGVVFCVMCGVEQVFPW